MHVCLYACMHVYNLCNRSYKFCTEKWIAQRKKKSCFSANTKWAEKVFHHIFYGKAKKALNIKSHNLLFFMIHVC